MLTLGQRVRHRDDADQRLGVGVLGVGHDLLGLTDLDDAPEVHHGDAVADHPRQREIVGDEDVGDAELLLLLHHQLEDVVADGDVEGGDGLVGDDHVGVEHGGAGDADALPLPAAELVRVAVQVLGRRTQPGLADRLDDLLFLLAFARAHAVDLERLGDDVEDRLLGIDGVVRVLEDDLRLLAVLAQLLARVLAHRLALVEHVAAGGLLQAQEGAAGRRLAAPRLPTRARISPFITWKLMWSTALTNFFSVETMLLKKLSWIGK